MRSGRAPGRTTAALVAGTALALALAAPAARADSDLTSFGFGVSPTTVVPGGKVTLTATDCAGRATASAPALFGDVTLGKGHGPGQVATATVDGEAKPGARYDVTFTCGSQRGTAALTVAAGTTSTGTTSTGTKPTAAVRTGAVRTGLGGDVSAPNAREILAGGVLVAAAGVLVVRRRRATRG
ncbi:hypothetical protein ACFZAM_31055 [Streptomyces sp. NPDC008079]|uniref:hypothetical protein n=1 Tax=Streptomyces sp. NPDC008079 TaxID=3364806 RepID=UPI0036ECAB45